MSTLTFFVFTVLGSFNLNYGLALYKGIVLLVLIVCMQFISCSHVNKRTTYTDPRLAFAHEDCGRPDVISQRFDAYSSALGVLQGRDLSDKYAVVTGATTGIGR